MHQWYYVTSSICCTEGSYLLLCITCDTINTACTMDFDNLLCPKAKWEATFIGIPNEMSFIFEAVY